ncbi:TIGR01777 family oxidoreductase [Candidatus Bipolaricaulota bacterium]|nr:TIGR01777 family oxidoreductase [Candidatus Bipolaricaulota bacterium]MCF7890335.1 TIGR01777 family oxidoreductase [Candidatus Bipolaricaulota bacterium]
MQVIITGGTGLIGKELVKELSASGHRAVVLSRSPEKRQVPGNTKLVEWDAKSADGWKEWVEESDAIVNLAGENIAGKGLIPDRWTPTKKSRILNSRLKAGEAVNEAVKSVENKPRVLIQASAIGYYGTGEGEVTENSTPEGDFLAETARKWEGITRSVEELGVRRAVIRTGIVLSSEGGVLPRLQLPYRLFLGGPLGTGRQWYSWIHVIDEVKAIRFLLENEKAEGPFNLTAPNPRRNDGFGEELGEVMGRPSYLRVPGFLFRVLLGEAAKLVLEGQKVKPTRLEELGFEFDYPLLEEALEDLLGQG